MRFNEFHLQDTDMLPDGLKKFVAKHLFIDLFSVLSNEKKRESMKERRYSGDSNCECGGSP